MSHREGEPRPKVRSGPFADHPNARGGFAGPVRRAGRLRLPLSIACRPWATLYVLPSGDTIWSVHLWMVDRPVVRFVGTDVLRRYARENRLDGLARDLERLLATAGGSADGAPR